MIDAICPIPWNHAGIQQNGDYRICCQNIHHPFGKLSIDGDTANIKNCEFNEARNLPEIVELRKDMVNGVQNKLCSMCYDEEKSGLPSKRLHMLRDYGIPDTSTMVDGKIDTSIHPIKYIDIRFGNLCNLKCRYCGPADSSLWLEEYADSMHEEVVPMWFYGNNQYKITKNSHNKWQLNTDDFEWHDSELFWDNFVKIMPHIDRYYFTGGEPLINKSHMRMLELIVKHGHASKIVIEYNSNMVAVPPKMYEIWANFKYIKMGCSIDGIGEMANYLRYPSEWSIIEHNLETMSASTSCNIDASISTTISAFNVLHFLDLTKFFMIKNYRRIKQVPSFHVLHGPSYMSIQVLPMKTKLEIKKAYLEFYEYVRQHHPVIYHKVKSSYDGILNFMFADDKSHLLPKLKSSIESMDKYRGQDITNSVPWLAKIL